MTQFKHLKKLKCHYRADCLIIVLNISNVTNVKNVLHVRTVILAKIWPEKGDMHYKWYKYL